MSGSWLCRARCMHCRRQESRPSTGSQPLPVLYARMRRRLRQSWLISPGLGIDLDVVGPSLAAQAATQAARLVRPRARTDWERRATMMAAYRVVWLAGCAVLVLVGASAALILSPAAFAFMFLAFVAVGAVVRLCLIFLTARRIRFESRYVLWVMAP